MVEVMKSSCPLNCWDSCGFNVTIKDEKVIKVDGDPDHPITKGKICGRGRKLEARTNDPERILHPLKKVDGEFREVSWEEALDEIASKMKDVKDKYGSTAVMHSHDYSNNGLLKNLDLRFFNAYGGITEVVGSLCWGAGIEAQTWDFGNAYSHAPEDIKNSKHIVVWGRNAARTNIHLFAELQAAKKRGVPIIAIDPVFNAVAKISDLYVPVKPGTDGMLALGIMKAIVQLKREDKSFINHYTLGFEDLEKTLNDITLDEIEKITDVSYETMFTLAELYTDGPTSTFIGLGMQRYKNGGEAVRSIDALVAISGNVGRPGGGANYANLAVGQSFNMNALALPQLKTSYRSFTRMKQAEGILQAKNPQIKMMFITRGNPLTQLPDTNVVKKAFDRVETKIVIDQFMTDTAKMADYILPCTTVFEEEDLYYSSMYHHFVNYGPALVPAPGEAKSDLYIWTELASRLGFGEVFDYTIDEFFEMGLSHLKDSEVSLKKIKEEKRVPLPVPIVPWADFKFQTPSGKYEFTSLKAQKEGKDGKIKVTFAQESAEKQPELAKQYPYQLISMHPTRSNHSQHYPWNKKDQSPTIEISQEISTKYNLEEGDWVEVYNNRGSIKGKVVVLKDCHPSVINVDEGRWSIFGGTVNQLTSSEESTIGLGSTLYDCLVNIRKTS